MAPCGVTGVLWADTFNIVIKSAMALKLDNSKFDGECKAYIRDSAGKWRGRHETATRKKAWRSRKPGSGATHTGRMLSQ